MMPKSVCLKGTDTGARRMGTCVSLIAVFRAVSRHVLRLSLLHHAPATALVQTTNCGELHLPGKV